MVEVVVTLRDAVMASLLAWGGMGDTQMAVTDPSLRAPPIAAPAVDKAAEPAAKPEATLRRANCHA